MANRMTRFGSMIGVLVLGAAAAALDGCTEERPSAASVSTTSPQSFVTATGACSAEGTVRACKVSLGAVDGYPTCFVGQQDCRNGVWSDCENGDVTISSMPVAATRGLRIANATPRADSVACKGDPCDPYCLGFDVDAGALTGTPDAGSSGSSGSYSAFGGSPPGFANKQVCQGDRACDDPTPGKCNGQDHCNMFDSCQADYHCDTTSHSCVANHSAASSFTWPASTCNGVDLTVGPACSDTSGVAGFTICNRGTKDLAGPTAIGISLLNGDPGLNYSVTPAPQCENGVCAKNTPDCTVMTAATGIPKGACVRVTQAGGDGSLACSAWTGTGNPVAYVNSNLAIAECGNSACGSSTCTAGGTPGCRNNYADVKDRGTACTQFGMAYSAKSTSSTYNATCRPGFKVVWKGLAWDASIPGGSVVFTAQTRPVLGDGGLGTATPATPGTVATVTGSGSTYPARCMMGELGGCPVSFATALGAGSATSNASLTITATVHPSADKQLTPTLNGFWVSYRCVPNE